MLGDIHVVILTIEMPIIIETNYFSKLQFFLEKDNFHGKSTKDFFFCENLLLIEINYKILNIFQIATRHQIKRLSCFH